MLYANDLSNALTVQDTFAPQSLSSTGNGTGVTVSQGGNLINALLSVGAVNTFTSLAVKMQAFDGSAWADIPGATFTSVTAANNVQLISFQLPQPTSVTANPYTQVRAVATLVGTSALIHVAVMEMTKMPNPGGGFQNAPPVIN